MKAPRKTPCISCPYRQDAPSGLWSASEYEKLPEYDGPTGEQPAGVFGCHQQDGHLCAGWVAVHDMEENMALRISLVGGFMTHEEYEEICEYKTRVPVFASGAEAAAHGLRDLDNPDAQAVHLAARILKKIGKL